jgi:hypothetical protein
MDDELVIQAPELSLEEAHDSLKDGPVNQAISPRLMPAHSTIRDRERVRELKRIDSPPRSLAQLKPSGGELIIEAPVDDASHLTDLNSGVLSMSTASFSPDMEINVTDASLRATSESDHLVIHEPLETEEPIAPHATYACDSAAMETFFPGDSAPLSVGGDNTLTILPPEDLHDSSEPMDIDRGELICPASTESLFLMMHFE